MHHLLILVVLMMTFRSRWKIGLLAVVLAGAGANAGEADVLDVHATLTGQNTYRFDVSVAHADEGWAHYANAFEILDLEGNVLGVRKLAHPHVDEQPFTRSLGSGVIPDNVEVVIVRAVDSVHGTGGKEQEVQLPEN